MNEKQLKEEIEKRQKIAYLTDKLEARARWVKHRNQQLNILDCITKSITEYVECFPLDSTSKKQYVELLFSGEETKSLEFCQNIDNNWWTLNFLLYYAKTQINGSDNFRKKRQKKLSIR
ncbi:MAG: hypothetical protein HC847_27160 [Hydrococcus sp. RU_2_2]|nr:hypothetical protein [Hydrococcus sp. RU_2_2]